MSNDGWLWQGRQYHQWFGNGTKPKDDLFAPDNAGERIATVANTVIGHLPQSARGHASAAPDRDALGQLHRAMTAWYGARALNRDAFRQRFLDATTSDATVDGLRAAARGAIEATTAEALCAAGSAVAGAMQRIGLDRWPRYLAAAAERAGVTGDAVGRPYQVAQAATPNTATDATLGGNSVPAAVPGRYVGDNPRQWIGRPPVGTGECVPLVQAATGAPRSTEWRLRVAVQGNTAIRPGTAIATSDANGHYTGHAAIYLSQDEHGIQVIDQWNIRDSHGHIIRQQSPIERTLTFNDSQHSWINRGEYYRVVE